MMLLSERVCLVLSLLVLIAAISAKDLSKAEKSELDLIAEDESLNEIDDSGEDNDAGSSEVDPCLKKRCGPGRICEASDKSTARCVCIHECPIETDVRRKVCSNHNETWSSDCEVYRMRCQCAEGAPECKGDRYKHVHVDYYGQCREIPRCGAEEMSDFPRRMREWLSNILRDLAERKELRAQFVQLEREADAGDLAKRWANAVIWKFCDLDAHPHDRSVSRHELFPLRAPLLSMEHCIAPFLDGCDADDDHSISLKEWGACLGLQDSEIEDKCTAIRDNE